MTTPTFLKSLAVHHLSFVVQAQHTLHLGPQAGGQLRGALWSALKEFACTDPAQIGDPQHSQHCPMCRLISLETNNSPRGANPPRPFTIQPPLSLDAPRQDRRVERGESLEFGISLFGDAAGLFPYVCQGVYRMGQNGVGYGRGTFSLQTIRADNPITGDQQDLFSDGKIIATPDLPITHDLISRNLDRLDPYTARLMFVTPAQLTLEKGRMAHRPVFDKLIARLIERCQAIELHYTDDPTPQSAWRDLHLDLMAKAAPIQRTYDDTQWVSVESGSRRTTTRNTMSGFVGRAAFSGDMRPFHRWLLWGQSLHIGKNAAKGNGWYVVFMD